jgi:ankyrin repeat protein
MAPHKKHLDAHGQTFLARACARGEYEGAKTRLTERPEDLNVADYAGNTPLQIAAINGCEDIVKLLIDAGCNLDCVNYDKDTPLLDAVDNGHLGVVKLLLDAGVNPRKANVNGEEPIDRVSDDTDNAEEIRAALMAARKRAGDRRRTSEEHHSHQDQDARDSHAPDSPRRSPATNSGSGRRTGTVRATKTRNDLLYMPLDEKTLRQAAGRGDEETVARILQVKEGFNDPESMVAAARGGHDLVIQLLLGLGGANPDPRPVYNAQPEFATPILAAIGQENIKVVELLLEQAGFDPTRRYKGETYYEIARQRAGPNWKDEEHMLKNAYDEYKRSHKDSAKTKSPSRRERDQERGDREEREAKRARRAETKDKDEARQHKRNLSSPEPKKKSATSKLTSPREKRRSNSITNQGDENSKRGPGRPRKEDRIPSINVSDREVSPTMSHKQLKAKHVDSDAAAASSEGETVKPRRKLISKGELRGERDRERQRRASMASNASSLKDHPTSPHESKHEEPADKHDKHDKNRVEKLSEKYHDRAKALKRDESRDRLSVSGDGSTKRHRASITPDRPSNGNKDDSEVPPKRRRLESETKEKRPKQALSSDERPRKSSNVQDSSKLMAKSTHKKHDDDRREKRVNSHRADTDRASSAERQIHVKSEETDVEMKDADSIKAVSESELQAARAKEAREAKEIEQEKQRQAETEAAKREELRKKDDARKREEERKRAEAEAAKQHEEEEARKKAEEEIAEKERLRKEEEEREAELKRKDEQERQRREDEKQRREAEEKARQEEEEKRRVEVEKKKKEEEEKRQREEEERLHREQLEREAAEEARRQREEEERKERERRERAHREDQERKRAAREAEQRRFREEQERMRLSKLPPLLRWLDTCPNPKLPVLAEKFKRIQGCRYDTIRREANGTPEGREQWVLNTHVALLLGEKDLDLSRCKSRRCNFSF